MHHCLECLGLRGLSLKYCDFYNDNKMFVTCDLKFSDHIVLISACEL